MLIYIYIYILTSPARLILENFESASTPNLVDARVHGFSIFLRIRLKYALFFN